MTDTSGFEMAAGENRELAAEVRARVEAGRRPEALESGHIDDVAKVIPITAASRRKLLKYLAAGIFTQFLGKDSYNAFDLKETPALLKYDSFQVGQSFAHQICQYEYNNAIFSAPLESSSASMGEQAIFNSHYFLRTQRFLDLSANISHLERALDNTEAEDAKAFILQRLIIDNNYLGHGRSAAIGYAKSLAKLDFCTFSSPVRKRLVSRSIDAISTATLNTMDSRKFKYFSDADLSFLRDGYALLDLGFDYKRDALLTLALDGMNASTFSLIQAKWMHKINSAEHDLPGDVAVSLYRREWFGDVLFVANGVGGHHAAEEMSEDFFCTICRIAFHAFAWHDEEHLHEILDMYFKGSPTLRPHLAVVRQAVMDRSSANIQWIKLLRIAFTVQHDPKQAKLYYIQLAREFAVRKAANISIHRAFLEIGNRFGVPYSILDRGTIVDAFIPASPVENQLSYYHLIVSQEI